MDNAWRGLTGKFNTGILPYPAERYWDGCTVRAANWSESGSAAASATIATGTCPRLASDAFFIRTRGARKDPTDD